MEKKDKYSERIPSGCFRVTLDGVRFLRLYLNAAARLCRGTHASYGPSWTQSGWRQQEAQSAQTGSSTAAFRLPSRHGAPPPPHSLTRPPTLSGAWLSAILCSARSSSCQAEMLMVPTLWFSADLWAKLRVSQQHFLTLSTVGGLTAPLQLEN